MREDSMGPEHPEVSVVMPNYNKGRFISAAIQSVLDQTFSDLELIIVDDASTDDSVLVAERYARAHGTKVRLLEFSERKGPAAARNAGIRSAKGEVICFLDSDDLYSPQKVERQLDALKAETKPMVVYCDWWRIDQEGNMLNRGKRERLQKSGRVFPNALRMVFGFSTMFLVRKELLEAVGLYDESLWWAEDYDLALKLARDYDFKYLEEQLYGYRTHEENTRNLRSRKERLYYEGLVTERHFKSGKSLLDAESENKVTSLMMRYFALTGQRSKMLRYGLSGFGAFRSMVSSLLNYREIR
ncbi:MAG TPA: glycosyltransferase [Nitrososphaerales archaeon]|nr:glycosyltransferase [Nitrososphaerales archaeon]